MVEIYQLKEEIGKKTSIRRDCDRYCFHSKTIYKIEKKTQVKGIAP